MTSKSGAMHLFAAAVGCVAMTYAPPSRAEEPVSASARVEARPVEVSTDDARGRVVPLVLGGLGAAQIITGIVLVAAAPDTPSNCDDATRTCVRLPGQTNAQLNDDQEQAGRADKMPTLGAMAIVSGATFLATGLAMYLWYRPSSRTAASRPAIVPYAAPDGGGLAAFARF
jgi:hypothetical protein